MQTIKKAVSCVTFSWYTSVTALCKRDEVFVALNRWTITAYYASPQHELLILCNFILRNACLRRSRKLDFLIISPNKRDEFESSAGVSSPSLEVASLKTPTGDSEHINRRLWVIWKQAQGGSNLNCLRLCSTGELSMLYAKRVDGNRGTKVLRMHIAHGTQWAE